MILTLKESIHEAKEGHLEPIDLSPIEEAPVEPIVDSYGTATVSTCKMAMYDQTYFRGKLVEITGSVNDFETVSFDNSIASVKVEGNCCWILFAEKDFQGASVILQIGDYKSATNIIDVFKKASSAKNSCDT